VPRIASLTPPTAFWALGLVRLAIASQFGVAIRFNVSRVAFVRSFRLNWQPGGLAMTANLEILIEAARKVRPSPDQEEEQRRSFAYGNTAFENSLIAFSTELRSSGGAEP
jgi:hypothetical protein